MLLKSNMMKNKDFFAFKFPDAVFIKLINVEMPTIVDNVTFISMINYVLSLS